MGGTTSCRATPILQTAGKQLLEGSAASDGCFPINPLPASTPPTLQAQRAGQQRVALRGHSGPRPMPLAPRRSGLRAGSARRSAPAAPRLGAPLCSREARITRRSAGSRSKPKGPGSPGERGQSACGLGQRRPSRKTRAEAVAPFGPSEGFLLETAPCGEEGNRAPSRNKS